MKRICAAALAIATVVGLGGCTDPYSKTDTTPAPKTTTTDAGVTQAQRTGEYPTGTDSVPEPPPATGGLGDSPTATLERFAHLYVNWTATTVADQLDRLARASTGQAAQDLAEAAARTRGDYELRRGGVFNRGTVRTIAADRGHPDRYVVVTLESTGAKSRDYEGLKPAYHVTLAQVKRAADGSWTVSSWQPQN